MSKTRNNGSAAAIISTISAPLDGTSGTLSIPDGAIGKAKLNTTDFTAAGLALMDDAAASNQRTTLGLDTCTLAAVRSFTETAGSGTYTATVVLPANSVLIGVYMSGHVDWTSSVSAALSLGYTGSLTAFINALDVTTDNPATASPIYGFGLVFASGTTITCSVAAVDVASGADGREKMTVLYAVSAAVAATKA